MNPAQWVELTSKVIMATGVIFHLRKKFCRQSFLSKKYTYIYSKQHNTYTYYVYIQLYCPSLVLFLEFSEFLSGSSLVHHPDRDCAHFSGILPVILISSAVSESTIALRRSFSFTNSSTFSAISLFWILQSASWPVHTGSTILLQDKKGDAKIKMEGMETEVLKEQSCWLTCRSHQQ